MKFFIIIISSILLCSCVSQSSTPYFIPVDSKIDQEKLQDAYRQCSLELGFNPDEHSMIFDWTTIGSSIRQNNEKKYKECMNKKGYKIKVSSEHMIEGC